MIHAPSAIIARDNRRHVCCGIGSITVHQIVVCVKVVIGICSDHRLIAVRHLLVTGGSQISIELHRIRCMRDEGRSRLTRQDIAIGFDHTTVMVIGKAVSTVCSLLRNQHGILAVTEIIALYKDVCSFHCTHANL